MSLETKIDDKKLGEIIKFACEELERRNDQGVSKDTAATHIAEKMKEVLSDDFK